MSRVTLHTIDSAPEQAQPLLIAAKRSNGGYLPNLLAALANAPAALESYLTVSAINARSSLTPEEREVVQLVAATTHGCGFCVAGHSALAERKTRLAAGDIEALRAARPPRDPRLAALAEFAAAVIAQRGAVSDPAFAAFEKAGFDAANALDVVLGIGLATLCNFANNLARTELNPELEPYRWTAAR